ncbi:MAG: beta-ketoacyl synthase N-terminal-like domain-containing protein [Gemmataceae bacterium]
MTAPRRAVLTGVGVLSPVGCDPAAFWAGLTAGGPARARPVTLFDASPLPTHVAYEVDSFDAKKFIPAAQKDTRKSLKVMARTIQLGVCAAQQVMDTAGPAKGTIDPDRFGIEFGCVMVGTELEELAGGAVLAAKDTPGKVDLGVWGTDGLRAVQPLWMLKYLPNMPACHVSVTHDARGPNNTITAGDLAGLLALTEAYRILGRGLADYFLVGGCESKLGPVGFCRHNSFQQLSRRNATPADALRPFDADRDGTLLGEAAAVFGLEDLAFAQKRGATVLAEVVGVASGFARKLNPALFARVIRQALKEAGVQPADVDHVNSSAGGFTALDAFEARAIAEVFGPNGVPVFAPRGHVGTAGAASGLVELAASVLALHHGQLPGTLNHAKAGADCPVHVHTGPPRPVAKPYALKVTTTDLGQVAAVVVRKWDGV